MIHHFTITLSGHQTGIEIWYDLIWSNGDIPNKHDTMFGYVFWGYRADHIWWAKLDHPPVRRFYHFSLLKWHPLYNMFKSQITRNNPSLVPLSKNKLSHFSMVQSQKRPHSPFFFGAAMDAIQAPRRDLTTLRDQGIRRHQPLRDARQRSDSAKLHWMVLDGTGAAHGNFHVGRLICDIPSNRYNSCHWY